MSLGVVIKGPEGVVLAADCRVTLSAGRPGEPPLRINFDNATKVLSFTKPNDFVGAVTYGQAVIGTRTASSFVPEFELELRNEAESREAQARLTVHAFAEKLSAFFVGRWTAGTAATYQGPPMVFIVGGYDEDAAHGRVFLFTVPNAPTPEPRYAGDDDFGMTWGGQGDVATRLIKGFDDGLASLLAGLLQTDEAVVAAALEGARQHLELKIPYNVLPLQDCIDLSILLIRTTIAAHNLSVCVRGVGGPIEVATITRTEPLTFIQRKQLVGEVAAGRPTR